MAADSRPRTPPTGPGRAWLRNGTELLIVALLLGAMVVVLDLCGERPDYYQPARGAITDAALILSETYGTEKELLSKFQAVHRHLEDAIALLDRAERLDPADKRRIATLRVRLQALEDPDRMTTEDPEEMHRSYHSLMEQLNALAHKLEHPRT
jgi:hypothetical protein